MTSKRHYPAFLLKSYIFFVVVDKDGCQLGFIK